MDWRETGPMQLGELSFHIPSRHLICKDPWGWNPELQEKETTAPWLTPLLWIFPLDNSGRGLQDSERYNIMPWYYMPIIILRHWDLFRTPTTKIMSILEQKYATSLEFREGEVGQLSITKLLYEILQELYCIEVCGPNRSVWHALRAYVWSWCFWLSSWGNLPNLRGYNWQLCASSFKILRNTKICIF